MSDPDLFDALRAEGVDADDQEVRAAVHLVTAHVDDVRQRHGPHRARRCMEALHMALAYQLQHPDVGDMSGFEAAFDEEE